MCVPAIWISLSLNCLFIFFLADFLVKLFFLSICKTYLHIFKVVNFWLAALLLLPIHSLFIDLYFAMQEAFCTLFLYKQVCLFFF